MRTTFLRDESASNREIDAIERLRQKGFEHPNIIQIFGHGRLDGDGRVYINMELCDINLHEYIKVRRTVKSVNLNGLLEWNAAEAMGQRTFLIVAILQQIMAGLNFLHKKGEVHRDLDPKNGNSPHPITC